MLISRSDTVSTFGDTDRAPKVHVHVGNALDVLADMPSDSIHCCVTSPPYWSLRSYEGDPGMIGMEPTFDEHLANLVAVFREVRRVLRDDGTLWCNYGDAYAGGGRGNYGDGQKQKTNTGSLIPPVGRLPSSFQGNNQGAGSVPEHQSGWKQGGFKPKDLMLMPARVAMALQADGWYLRSEVVWHKSNPMPESVTDRPTNAHEKLYLLSKAPRYFYDSEAVRVDARWTRENNPDWQHQRAATNEKKGGGNRNAKSGGFTKWDAANGANLRNVWRIATHAFSGAHFATFPPALVEPCIKAGTSEWGVCTVCGSPWKREVSHSYRKHRPSGSTAGRAADGTKHSPDGNRDSFGNNLLKDTVTTNWRPTCDCNAPRTQAIILDPFAGAGTTGLVAARYGRSARLVEISPHYADMMAWRIQDATEADVRIHAP